MRFHTPNFLQLDSPVLQCWISNEPREFFVVDRQDFRNNKRCRFTDFGYQVLNLSDPCEVFVVRTILRQLQRRVVIDALHLQLERFLKFQNRRQRLRRLTYFALPLLKSRIGALEPGEILLPFAYIGKEMCEIPFVGFGNVRARWDLFSAHWKCGKLTATRRCCRRTCSTARPARHQPKPWAWPKRAGLRFPTQLMGRAR